MTAQALIQQALARGIKAGTVLQEAIDKVRKARQRSETEFEIALGELFVLSSDAFRSRNGFQNKVKELEKQNKKLNAELEAIKNEHPSSQSRD